MNISTVGARAGGCLTNAYLQLVNPITQHILNITSVAFTYFLIGYLDFLVDPGWDDGEPRRCRWGLSSGTGS